MVGVFAIEVRTANVEADRLAATCVLRRRPNIGERRRTQVDEIVSIGRLIAADRQASEGPYPVTADRPSGVWFRDQTRKVASR